MSQSLLTPGLCMTPAHPAGRLLCGLPPALGVTPTPPAGCLRRGLHHGGQALGVREAGDVGGGGGGVGVGLLCVGVPGGRGGVGVLPGCDARMLLGLGCRICIGGVGM